MTIPIELPAFRRDQVSLQTASDKNSLSSHRIGADRDLFYRLQHTEIFWRGGPTGVERRSQRLRENFSLIPFPRLTERVCEPEVMDDPTLDRERHFDALRGLARLNGLSFSARMLWLPIWRLARERKVDHLRILDVATGAGDLPIRLWKKAQRANLKLDIHGVDISPQALEFAKRNAAAQGAPIAFSEFNVLRQELPQGYDVVISSLFFHHLEEQHARALLLKMTKAASSMVLVNDLRRSLGGWVLAHAAARTLTRSDVVHFDAPASVRAAWTIPEIRNLAISVGLPEIRVTSCWPFRFLLEWRRRS